jgi:hypothetical protein
VEGTNIYLYQPLVGWAAMFLLGLCIIFGFFGYFGSPSPGTELTLQISVPGNWEPNKEPKFSVLVITVSVLVSSVRFSVIFAQGYFERIIN